MTIVEALREFIAESGLLEAEDLLAVDHVSEEVNPNAWNIVPLPGAPIIEEYLDGSSLRQFPFAIQLAAYTADDQQRLTNSGLMEQAADLFERKTADDELPELGSGRTAEKLQATTSGFLLQDGESGTGIYQISCSLEYHQAAETVSDESE